MALKLREITAANADFLVNPQLETRTSTGVTVAANDNWSSLDSPLLAATQAAGAFRPDLGSKDAAFLVILPPGAYPASVRSASGAAGPTRVKIFDSEVTPAKKNARLAVDAVHRRGSACGSRFGYQPRLRLIATGGVSAATVVTLSFNTGEGRAGKVLLWSPGKPSQQAAREN